MAWYDVPKPSSRYIGSARALSPAELRQRKEAAQARGRQAKAMPSRGGGSGRAKALPQHPVPGMKQPKTPKLGGWKPDPRQYSLPEGTSVAGLARYLGKLLDYNDRLRKIGGSGLIHREAERRFRARRAANQGRW